MKTSKKLKDLLGLFLLGALMAENGATQSEYEKAVREYPPHPSRLTRQAQSMSKEQWQAKRAAMAE